MLDVIDHGMVRELRMARPPVNAMDPELVHRLRDAVRSAPDAGCKALVISGREGLFSGGLDVAALLELDRKQFAQFFADFLGMLQTVAASRIPIAAAITGQAPAGGAVLATFCDYRVMAAGDYKFGYNEVAVGLVVPWQVHAAVARIVGNEMAERLCVEGRMISSSEVHRLGLAHELLPVADVVPRAIDWCRKITALPSRAMLKMRTHAREDLVEPFKDIPEMVEIFVDVWFGEEAQSTLNALMAKLRAKAK